MTTKPPVFVFGDSHVCYLNWAVQSGLLPRYDVSSLRMEGATAAGLNNPRSSTRSSAQVFAATERLDRDTALVSHFGEIDCGANIWRRMAKYGTTRSDEVASTIAGYLSVLDGLRLQGFKRIIITAATLPTISDNDQGGGIVNAMRSSIRATQAERTALSREFNKSLRQIAAEGGYSFLDPSDKFIDPISGLVSVHARNANPADHHMDNAIAGSEWAAQLQGTLDRLSGYSPQIVRLRAKQDTLAKSTPQAGSKLQSFQISKISEGEILTAHHDDTGPKQIVVSGAFREREALNPLHRVLHAGHWQRVG